jgi:predicted nuclease of predicted toxin-antitoxin system
VKILLDEYLPHRLRPLLTGHDVFTVAFMKWKGVQNGELLALAAANGFDVVITKDTGMPYQQNTERLPCSIVVLEAPTNELEDIRPLVPGLMECLKTLSARTFIRWR